MFIWLPVYLLSVALDCIGQVYKLDLTDQEHITTYGIGKSLEVGGIHTCTCTCTELELTCLSGLVALPL